MNRKLAAILDEEDNITQFAFTNKMIRDLRDLILDSESELAASLIEFADKLDEIQGEEGERYLLLGYQLTLLGSLSHNYRVDSA